MKTSLRSLLKAVLIPYAPTSSSHQVRHLAANPLHERGDHVLPGLYSDPPPTPTPPPPPPPVTVTITSISTSTSLITTTINVTVSATNYVTNTEIFTTAIPTTSLTTITKNDTVTIPPTQARPTHVSDVSAVADVKKPVSASEVLAIVFGVVNIVLLLVMFFFVRRFYRMYRQERVLRKQVQTEGVELTWPKQVGVEDVEGEDQWWVKGKQERNVLR